MKKLNAEPDFVARRSAQQWTPAQREAKRAEMIARNADPAFRAKQLASIPTRRPRRITAADHTHPLVRGLFREMADQQASRKRVARSAGVSAFALSGWRSAHMPMLDTIDAALGVLGFELAIVPIGTRDQYGFPQKKTRTTEGVQS
ncbi:hypothetical protein HU230_0008090 [Bradyrhizobium quebecense]|uniref:Uncharacterized protein n=1 Tax=Bradyrhizobium quebecense TaxID=2748629 RepID=A0A973WPB9_9BRAD|nr:hypothetical protein [Bradyrhizobium quebecense]UGA45986.1 hypothetical protein HU230_0008090 [Bradyrhizobium quebecense]